jgi:enoyl-CoA hydratase
MANGPQPAVPIDPAGVHVARRGAAEILTLARGSALNALTPSMLAALDAAYRRIARDINTYVVILQSADPKAFSAGGDVRALSALARTDLEAARACLRAEYSLNWLHACFSKPTVALIDGLVMGSGVGISAYATHRVAGPGYRFAMPETAIGFFPDVGMAHVLSRMPSQIGVYLGLTGHAIGRADALALGLVTHCLEREQLAELEPALAEAMPVDPLLDARHRDPGPSPLMEHASLIDHCFGAATVEEIMGRLAAIREGPSHAFARTAAADLASRSPLALKVTLRHLRDARRLDLRQTLEADYRLACRFLEAHDFHDGVRAALIDKGSTPRWQPKNLADVSLCMVDDFFSAAPGLELHLRLQQDMQLLRI